MLIGSVTVPEGTRGPWTISKFEVPKQPDIYALRLMICLLYTSDAADE